MQAPLIDYLQEALILGRTDPRLNAHELAELHAKDKMFAILAESIRSGDRNGVSAAMAGAAFVLAFMMLAAEGDADGEANWITRFMRRIGTELALVKDLKRFAERGEVDDRGEDDGSPEPGGPGEYAETKD